MDRKDPISGGVGIDFQVVAQHLQTKEDFWVVVQGLPDHAIQALRECLGREQPTKDLLLHCMSSTTIEALLQLPAALELLSK